ESFNNVKSWLHEIERYAAEGVQKYLVGNKCDLESERAVSTEEAKSLAESLNISFIETSAKDSTNVEQAFLNLAKQIKYKMSQDILGETGQGGAKKEVNLSAGQNVNNTS
ncbi:hypothetical protein EV182_007924, partial [Spiromyces aspiralis]